MQVVRRRGLQHLRGKLLGVRLGDDAGTGSFQVFSSTGHQAVRTMLSNCPLSWVCQGLLISRAVAQRTHVELVVLRVGGQACVFPPHPARRRMWPFHTGNQVSTSKPWMGSRCPLSTVSPPSPRADES